MSFVKFLMRLAPVLAVTFAVGVAAAGRPSGLVDFKNVPFRFSRPSAAQTEIPASGPAGTVHNQYRVPTYGDGIAKAVGRLKGKDPLVMSSEDFAANAASLAKTPSAPAPTDGKARVKLEGNAILVRFAGHEERIVLKQPDTAPEDHEKLLEAATSKLIERMQESYERPERIEWSATDSSYVIITGTTRVVVPKPDMHSTIDVERPERIVDVDERPLDEPEIVAPAPRPADRREDVAQRHAHPVVN